jgi:hypothetical protein
MAETPPKMDFSKELVKGMKVHSTLEQEVLVTTSDKLRLCLIRHQKILAGRLGWIAPLGILLTMIATLVTTDFKDSYGLSKNTWEAIFVLGAVVVGLWLARSLCKILPDIFRGWTIGYDGTIEEIVNEMKRETSEVSALLSSREMATKNDK